MGKFDDDPPSPTSNVIALTPPDDRAPAPMDWPALDGLIPPNREWALQGWIGMGHATLLVGSGGIGKTLIAQQIGSALAIGHGNFIAEIPKQRRVLMWACEDDHDELWRRQVAIANSLSVSLQDFTNHFILVPRHGQENALCVSEFGKVQWTGTEKYLESQINDYDPDVVILDNVAQLYGAGENDRHAVTVFLNRLTGMMGRRALLLLAHPSRAQGSEFSGSGAWENVARTRLYLGSNLPDQKDAAEQGDEAQNIRYLSRRKANYSEKDWRRFTYADGVLVPDAIENGSEGGLLASLRADRAKDIIIEAMRKLETMGLFGAEGSSSPNFLPKLIMDYKLGDGRSRSELTAAMRSLMTDNVIGRAVIGKYSNRAPKYGLKAL